MAIRDILKMGDQRLLRIAQPVRQFNTPPLLSLLQDMRDTMAAAHGAGLAAPQIGVDQQVVIFGNGQINPRYPDAPAIPPTVLLNPTLMPILQEDDLTARSDPRQMETAQIAFDLGFSANLSDLEEGWEGCLSVPGLRAVVPRFKRIRYLGFDELGQSIDRTVDGFHARVVQHECDHLHGILYPMRVKDFRRFGFTEVLFPDLAGRDDD